MRSLGVGVGLGEGLFWRRVGKGRLWRLTVHQCFDVCVSFYIVGCE